MKDVLDRILELSLDLMKEDRRRGDALYYRAKKEFSNENHSVTTQNHDESEENQDSNTPTPARGEGIVIQNVQTVNVYIKEG